MLTKKQLTILAHFTPFEQLTYAELKRRAKEKSNNTIQTALAAFIDEGIVRKQRIGSLAVYTLNLENAKTHHYRGLLVADWLESLPTIDQKELRRIVTALTEKHPFSAIVLFGSFAEGKQKKESDIDIAVFTEDDEKEVELAIGSAEMRNFREIDLHVINTADMQEMLANEEFNLGKEIKRKHRALHNAAGFYEILLTARNPPAKRE